MVTQSAPTREPSLSTTDGDEKAETKAILLHGSAVRFCGKGILILGPSASGKSDLALRLIDAGAILIADDQVRITLEGNRLQAAPHDRIAGLISLRGIGIMRTPFVEAPLDLAVDLQSSDKVHDPLPNLTITSWLGVGLPKIALDSSAPSAVARIRLVLTAERAL